MTLATFTLGKVELSGKGGTDVSYSPMGAAGQPEMHYHDAQHGSRSFTGQQIRIQDTDIGQLITVTLHMTVDTGATLFTLLLPRFTFHSAHEKDSFETEGIVTTTRGPLGPGHKGPNETYRFVALHGTAEGG